MEKSKPTLSERLAEIIRRHEREREENYATAAESAFTYLKSLGVDGGQEEWARTEAMRLYGEHMAAERIIKDLKDLLIEVFKV